MKFNLHLIGEGTTLTDIKKKSIIKTAIGLSRIMIITITKIIYLYIRQKMCFLQIFGTKTKAKKATFGNIEYNGMHNSKVFCI